MRNTDLNSYESILTSLHTSIKYLKLYLNMSLFKDMEIKLIAGFNIQANHCEIFSDILNMLFFLDFGPAQKLHLFKS